MADSLSSVRVRHLEITPNYAGQRLDNFLLRELKGAPKSLIYRILRKGEVRLNVAAGPAGSPAANRGRATNPAGATG